MALETKFIAVDAADLSVRSEADRPAVVSGYLSTFSATPDSHKDIVLPGAFSDCVKAWSSRPYAMPMLLQHDGLPIGKWTTLREDGRGLFGEGELTPGHSVARDVEASLRHGAISGLSIGYKAQQAERDRAGIRRLVKVDVREASVVANPSNSETRVTAVKSASEMSVRDFEKALRVELGFSRREAEAIAADGFKSLLIARDGQTGSEDDDDPPRDGAGVESVLEALRGVRLTPDSFLQRTP